MKQIKINKVDAAIAHITSAIRLYFTDGPEASIHVLAATSLDIAEAFLKNTTFSVFTFNHAFANMDIRESNDLWKFLRDVQNDLKHADRNKENVITIKELHTEMLLFYAALLITALVAQKHPLGKIVGEPERLCYILWFKVKHHDLLSLNNGIEQLRSFGVPLPVDGHSKSDYFKWASQLFPVYENIQEAVHKNGYEILSNLVQQFSKTYQEQS